MTLYEVAGFLGGLGGYISGRVIAIKYQGNSSLPFKPLAPFRIPIGIALFILVILFVGIQAYPLAVLAVTTLLFFDSALGYTWVQSKRHRRQNAEKD